MLIYQVYPRSFQDSNGDGVGDLPGITARLEHIKRLGVDMVWIGPVFKSPMRDFGYDVADYRSVDPIFGELADLRHLIDSARQLGMGVMLDMVVSHTSDHHVWFEASRRREDGKDDWYLWADARPDGTPPNNWMSVFGGDAWNWDATRRQYYFHTFLDSQPDLNFHHPAVQQQALDEMRFWLELGIAGFRFDACNHYFQDRELRSNPPAPGGAEHALHPYGFQRHLYDKNRPEVRGFLARVRELLDRYGAYSVAEVGGSDGAQLAVDYVAPGLLHSAYSFDLLRASNSAAYVRGILERLDVELPGPGVACHALSNHDKPRVASRWGEGRDPRAVARQMLALLACLRGTICLYQGEELGLTEADVPFERLQDPYGKRFWPRFKGRDGCRTPMPWNDGPHAGFSSGEPWLPMASEHLALNVAAQEADPHSVLHFARQAFALRRARPELHTGSLAFTATADETARGLLGFERHADGATLVCLFNLGDEALSVAAQAPERILLSGALRQTPAHTVLERNGFVIAERAR
jgi:alpha-glucosidase